jgi:hypothetical protein
LASGRSPRALPLRTTLGDLAFAGGVLPDATPCGNARLSVSWRDRPDPCGSGFSSEVSAPGSVAPCRERRAGRGADTPASFTFRVGTVLTGTAPAFGRALALCYGSSLLTLRLRSALQLGDVVWRRRPNKEDWRALPGPFSPRRHIVFARPHLADRALLAVGSARQRGCVLVCAVAAITLWVTALDRGSKHSAILSRLERGF